MKIVYRMIERTNTEKETLPTYYGIGAYRYDEKAKTYKHIVDLDTGREEVIQLQRVDKEGYYNRR